MLFVLLFVISGHFRRVSAELPSHYCSWVAKKIRDGPTRKFDETNLKKCTNLLIIINNYIMLPPLGESLKKIGSLRLHVATDIAQFQNIEKNQRLCNDARRRCCRILVLHEYQTCRIHWHNCKLPVAQEKDDPGIYRLIDIQSIIKWQLIIILTKIMMTTILIK